MGAALWLRQLKRSIGRDEKGAAAIEFGLVAPILALGLIASIDLGFAEYERMTIDHTLRSAAQYAMTDPGKTAVCERLRSLALKNYTSVSATCTAGEDADFKATVTRYCACPASLDVEVACSTPCGAEATYVYYRLTAETTAPYNLLPAKLATLLSSVQVQTR